MREDKQKYKTKAIARYRYDVNIVYLETSRTKDSTCNYFIPTDYIIRGKVYLLKAKMDFKLK